jgi:uncharacterized protein (TIGR03437 family)
LLSIFAALTAVAMSVSEDGKVVAFAENGKIIRWREGIGAEMVADADRAAPILANAIQPGTSTNYYEYGEPHLSADGRRLTYWVKRNCWSRCSVNVDGTSYRGIELLGDGTSVEDDSPFHFTQDGRFRVQWRRVGLFMSTEVTDMRSGVVIARDDQSAGARVAGDGTSIMGGRIRRPGGPPMEIAHRSQAGILRTYAAHELSYDGVWAYYFAQSNQIRRWHIDEKRDEFVYDAPPGSVAGLTVLRDGSLVVVTAGGAKLLTKTHTEELTSTSGQVVFSPDGRFAFVRPVRGPMERLTLRNNRVVQRELIWWYPVVRKVWRGVAGSQIRLAGAGLYWADGNYSARIAGYEAPIARFNEDRMWLQLPWELSRESPGAEHDLVIYNHGVETSRSRITLESPGPEFLGVPGGRPEVLREDQEASATLGAALGSIAHFHVIGLGAGERPMATGEWGPADPLVRVPNVECEGRTFSRGYEPWEVHYAGFVPNELGLYRISLRVGFSDFGIFQFRCRLGEGRWAGAAVPVR